jgi:hypothetical protein
LGKRRRWLIKGVDEKYFRYPVFRQGVTGKDICKDAARIIRDDKGYFIYHLYH